MKEVIQLVHVDPFLVLHTPVEGNLFFSYHPCDFAWATTSDNLFHTFIILSMKNMVLTPILNMIIFL